MRYVVRHVVASRGTSRGASRGTSHGCITWYVTWLCHVVCHVVASRGTSRGCVTWLRHVVASLTTSPDAELSSSTDVCGDSALDASRAALRMRVTRDASRVQSLRRCSGRRVPGPVFPYILLGIFTHRAYVQVHVDADAYVGVESMGMDHSRTVPRVNAAYPEHRSLLSAAVSIYASLCQLWTHETHFITAKIGLCCY